MKTNTNHKNPFRKSFVMHEPAVPEGTFHTKLTVRDVSSPPEFLPDDAVAGVFVAAARSGPGAAALVIVADVEGMGLTNEGASVTNAAQALITSCQPHLCSLFGCHPADLVWVEWDSTGRYDSIVRTESGAVSFAPLVADGAQASSRDALYAVHGDVARAVVRRLIYMALTDARNGGEPTQQPLVH